MLGTITPEELLYGNALLQERLEMGCEYRCPECYEVIELDPDDDQTELLVVETDGGKEYYHADCVRNSFTEELFWEYVKYKRLERDVIEWAYNGEVILRDAPEAQDVLLAGINYDSDAFWDYVEEDIDDYVEWLFYRGEGDAQTEEKIK